MCKRLTCINLHFCVDFGRKQKVFERVKSIASLLRRCLGRRDSPASFDSLFPILYLLPLRPTRILERISLERFAQLLRCVFSFSCCECLRWRRTRKYQSCFWVQYGRTVPNKHIWYRAFHLFPFQYRFSIDFEVVEYFSPVFFAAPAYRLPPPFTGATCCRGLTEKHIYLESLQKLSALRCLVRSMAFPRQSCDLQVSSLLLGPVYHRLYRGWMTGSSCALQLCRRAPLQNGERMMQLESNSCGRVVRCHDRVPRRTCASRVLFSQTTRPRNSLALQSSGSYKGLLIFFSWLWSKFWSNSINYFH